MAVVDLECSDLERLLEAAGRAADEFREPVLVLTCRPAAGYGSGCVLAYAVRRSQANEFERANAYREVFPGAGVGKSKGV